MRLPFRAPTSHLAQNARSYIGTYIRYLWVADAQAFAFKVTSQSFLLLAAVGVVGRYCKIVPPSRTVSSSINDPSSNVRAKKRAPPEAISPIPAYPEFTGKSVRQREMGGQVDCAVSSVQEISLPYPCILQYETPLPTDAQRGSSIGIPA